MTPMVNQRVALRTTRTAYNKAFNNPDEDSLNRIGNTQRAHKLAARYQNRANSARAASTQESNSIPSVPVLPSPTNLDRVNAKKRVTEMEDAMVKAKTSDAKVTEAGVILDGIKKIAEREASSNISKWATDKALQAAQLRAGQAATAAHQALQEAQKTIALTTESMVANSKMAYAHTQLNEANRAATVAQNKATIPSTSATFSRRDASSAAILEADKAITAASAATKAVIEVIEAKIVAAKSVMGGSLSMRKRHTLRIRRKQRKQCKQRRRTHRR
jgi:hypothetical protein